MSIIRISSRAAALAVGGVLAWPAAADVTAREVYENWLSLAEQYGQQITIGGEAEDAGVLVLTDVSSVMEEGGTRLASTIPEVVMTENGDGTVTITVSPEYPIVLSSEGEDGAAPKEIVLALSHIGLEMRASGDPDALSYDYTAERLAAVTTSASTGNPDEDISLEVSAADLSGHYEIGPGDPAPIEVDFTAALLSFELSGTGLEGEEGNDVRVSFRVEDFRTSSDGTLLILSAGADLPSLLSEGAATTGTFGYSGSEWLLAGTQPDGRFESGGGSGSVEASFAVGPEGLSYEDESRDVTIFFRSLDLPVPPMSLGAASTTTRLEMPLSASEEPQEFRLGLSVSDLALSEEVWTMFDPAGVLPRDPANLELALSGEGMIGTSLYDTEGMAALGDDEMPATVESVSIERLLLSLLGAQLEGSGSLDIDNDRTPPAPEGRIDLTLTGVEALLNALTTMGALPADQAMGARMMLGMFARPGDGEDTLVSTIEFGADGSITANGQRIR